MKEKLIFRMVSPLHEKVQYAIAHGLDRRVWFVKCGVKQ